MRLFAKTEVNTARQFEFDFAKAVCILGMVFVHCFEVFSPVAEEESGLYYTFVTVLDALFGAGTFMFCMGLGIAYSRDPAPDKLIRRGLKLFGTAYLLNLLRDGIPYGILNLLGYEGFTVTAVELLCPDILQFAGFSLMLFGLLRKAGCPDHGILAISVLMSAVGSFVRFLDVGHFALNELLGVLVGTAETIHEDAVATFPLLNWFIIVAAGVCYARMLRRLRDPDRFYAIVFPVSAAVMIVYMCIAIPNRLGMMSGDLIRFYQLSLPDMLILMVGAVFATGLYHMIGKLLGGGVKAVITRMSSNINSVYCIHWVIICWLSMALTIAGCEGVGDGVTTLAAILIWAAANLIAELWRRRNNNKRRSAA